MSPRAWTGAELKRLEALVARGISNKAIAATLNRSPVSISDRIKSLGLRRPLQRRPMDFTVRIPAELYDALFALARAEGVSKGHIVRNAILATLKEQEK